MPGTATTRDRACYKRADVPGTATTEANVLEYIVDATDRKWTVETTVAREYTRLRMPTHTL